VTLERLVASLRDAATMFDRHDAQMGEQLARGTPDERAASLQAFHADVLELLQHARAAAEHVEHVEHVEAPAATDPERDAGAHARR
jgi:hypothetical protein